MAEYIRRSKKVEAVQWNVPSKDGGKVMLGSECGDHPSVRGTTYMEISDLIGTSGCSKGEPMWDWSVMGVIETPYGKMVVTPGDFIVRMLDGWDCPCHPETFFKEVQLSSLKKREEGKPEKEADAEHDDGGVKCSFCGKRVGVRNGKVVKHGHKYYTREEMGCYITEQTQKPCKGSGKNADTDIGDNKS